MNTPRYPSSLRKILSLEQQKGYKNTAVMGGLDKFLTNIIADDTGTLPVSLPPEGYSSLNHNQKTTWIQESLRIIEDSYANKSTQQRKQDRRNQSTRKPANPKKQIREDLSLLSPVIQIPKITPSLATKLNSLGILTIRDLLYFFPRRHADFSNLRTISELDVDTDQSIAVTVWEARETKLGRNLRAAEAIVGDNTGNIRVIWFNQPYLAKQFKPGTSLLLSGKVSTFKGSRVLESPEYEAIDQDNKPVHSGPIIPVYPLTSGLTPRRIRRLIKQNLDQWLPNIQDPLPIGIRIRSELMGLQDAILQSHYPDNEDTKETSRRRLAFDELFIMQLHLLTMRKKWKANTEAIELTTDNALLSSFLSRLPFSLTDAQTKSLDEILEDVTSNQPMSRLLQGDVGSGKTVVALAALICTASNGFQSVLMAPTEILAEQHYRTIYDILGNTPKPSEEKNWFSFYLDPLPRPLSVGLLVGSQNKKEKQSIQELISQTSLDIVIGTHALLQPGVEIPKLSLVIVDEQHRFGVMQRSSLRGKAKQPHLLVMSATPIPRSLALTLYGDLDLSILDELPAGRQAIETKWVHPASRDKAYAFLRQQIAEGRQAFVVCPLIEESETLQTRAATAEYKRLSTEIFPDLSVGLLHGKMSGKEKENVMRNVYNKNLHILVSTSVIEVGIDIPNASTILVEGADRFGLAQLHQFRGRVGRGKHKSYCLLLSDSPSKDAVERLRVMEKIHNGFAVAEEDLKFRGPGQIFGTRQSGLPDLRVARLSDQDLIAAARKEAVSVLKDDPDLELIKHKNLSNLLTDYANAYKAELN